MRKIHYIKGEEILEYPLKGFPTKLSSFIKGKKVLGDVTFVQNSKFCGLAK